MPDWAGHSRKRADYRFRRSANRWPTGTGRSGRHPAVAVPDPEIRPKGTYKLFGVVTNRKDAGDTVIWWLRECCGKSEEVHVVMISNIPDTLGQSIC